MLTLDHSSSRRHLSRNPSKENNDLMSVDYNSTKESKYPPN